MTNKKQNLNHTQALGGTMTHSRTKVANIAQFIQSFKSNYDVRFSRKVIEEGLDYVLECYPADDGTSYWRETEAMTRTEALFGLYAVTKHELDRGQTPYAIEYDDVDSYLRECIRDAVLQARGVQSYSNIACMEQRKAFDKLKEDPTFQSEWKAAYDEGFEVGASTYVFDRLPVSSIHNLFNK